MATSDDDDEWELVSPLQPLIEQFESPLRQYIEWEETKRRFIELLAGPKVDLSPMLGADREQVALATGLLRRRKRQKLAPPAVYVERATQSPAPKTTRSIDTPALVERAKGIVRRRRRDNERVTAGVVGGELGYTREGFYKAISKPGGAPWQEIKRCVAPE